MNDEPTQSLTLTDMIAFVRRYALFAAAAALVAGSIAFVVSSFLPDVYQARATVLAAQTNPEFRQFGVGIATAAPLDIVVYQAAATTPEVIEDARERAMLAGVEDEASLRGLRGSVSIVTESLWYSSLLTISVRNEEPVTAARLANAMAGAIIAWDQRRARTAIDDLVRNLTMQIQALDQQIADLRAQGGITEDQIVGRINLRAEQQEQLYYARVLANSASGLLSVLHRAELPTSPVAPIPMRSGVIAAVLAALLLFVAGLLRDLLDTRLRTVDQVSGVTNLPLLAAFPVLDGNSRMAPREPSNFLRANLGFALANAHPKVIAATSAGPAEGKTTVAVSLATSFARQGYRTLLVDLDLRRPMVAQAFAISAGDVRVDQALANENTPLRKITIMLDEDTPLDVIPAAPGIDYPAERIASGISSLLARAQDDYDVIVLDTAPVMAVADALPICTIASATVFAVSLEHSNRRHVANALDVLRRAGATLAGTVVTHAPAGSKSEGYTYGYGYGYGYGSSYGDKQPTSTT